MSEFVIKVIKLQILGVGIHQLEMHKIFETK